MSTATETATIHEAATKRIEKKIFDMQAGIALLDPGAGPLATLFNELNKVNKDYEDAKALIREVCNGMD